MRRTDGSPAKCRRAPGTAGARRAQRIVRQRARRRPTATGEEASALRGAAYAGRCSVLSVSGDVPPFSPVHDVVGTHGRVRSGGGW